MVIYGQSEVLETNSTHGAPGVGDGDAELSRERPRLDSSRDLSPVENSKEVAQPESSQEDVHQLDSSREDVHQLDSSREDVHLAYTEESVPFPRSPSVRTFRSANEQPPSTLIGLANCLREEFYKVDYHTLSGRSNSHESLDARSLRSHEDRRDIHRDKELKFVHSCRVVVENRFVIGFFTILTCYALFVPDLDAILGNKDSELVLSIVTTCIFFLFAGEIVLTSIGKRNYFLHSYFWLDLVACMSLLPDTYFMHMLLQNNAFVAGRSTRLTRLVRAASRSSRVTRLNRLTRIVRVASLLPRLAALCGRRVTTDEAEKLLNKKLRRVFNFMDDDNDGRVRMSIAYVFMQTIRDDSNTRLGGIMDAFRNQRRKLSKGEQNGLTLDSSAATLQSFLEMGSEQSDRSPANVADRVSTSDTDPVYRSEPPSPFTPRTAASPRSVAGMKHNVSGSSRLVGLTHSSLATLRSDGNQSQNLSVKDVSSMSSYATTVREARSVRFDPEVIRSEYRSQGLPARPRRPSLTRRHISDQSYVTSADGELLITLEEFMSAVERDEFVRSKLLKACTKKLKHSNSMQNQTSKNTEQVGVKVALGVLLLLLVINIVDSSGEDRSPQCLEHIDLLMKVDSGGSTGSPIPQFIQDQVRTWARGVDTEDGDDDKRRLVYLDLNRHAYCNELHSRGQPCSGGDPNEMFWFVRESVEAVGVDYESSIYRIRDIDVILVPEESDDPDTLAVLNVRKEKEIEAVVSVITTTVVIILILSGILILAGDFTRLSKMLLNPLKELADEMHSIATLNLAAVTDEEVDSKIYEGRLEIMHIREAFDSMKKAVKSWGKYVPWPVVQALLHAGVDARNQVEEKEVTVFFSDIAGFTTIVETLSPEKSMLLLSRYFNEMSKAIDDHDGVILEFVGDAIMCIYGAPLINEDHSALAVKATLKMLHALKRLNEWGTSKNLPPISIRCGVHTGSMLVGNMGFRTRIKYGVVGEEANIPSKLEELNKTYGTNMLLSSGTHTQLPRDSFVHRPIDYLCLRASERSELVYEVIDRTRSRRHPLQSAYNRHKEAMEKYINKDFAAAAALFKQVGEQVKRFTHTEDKPSTMLHERCLAYMQHPPPEGWNGTWIEPDPALDVEDVASI